MTSKRRRVVTSRPSKNACRTCRARRVKCDEEKPACRKCKSTGRKCDGYISSRNQHGAVAARQLLPSSLVAQASEPSVILSSAYCNKTIDELQRNAFTYFLHEAAPSLARNFGSNEWLQLVLRTGAEMPMIFNAITAVGCMVHARSQILMTDHALTQLKSGLEEETALSQYCQATFHLQRYIDAAILHGADIEPVLICSLLFVLFETFRGEPLLASSHLRHGRRALQNAAWRSDGGDHRTESSKSHMATKKLLSTFDALEGETARFNLLVESEQLQSPPVVSETDCVRSFHFNTVDDAKQALDLLVVETSRWRAELLVLAQDRLSNVSQAPLSVAALNCVKHCFSRSVYISNDSSLTNKRKELVRAHEQWLARLDFLPPDTAGQSVRLLRMQHFYSYFLIVTSRDATGKQRMLLEKRCGEALDLAEQYLDRGDGACVGPTKLVCRQRNPTFSLEPGPLSVLFLISLNCRNADLRSRAMSLLRHANRREGLQWSGELSIYADCINEFEDVRAGTLDGEEDHRPLDWWFERIPEATRRQRLAIQGSGNHEIRIHGCRYLREDYKALELVELAASGVPPLHLKELRRINIPIPNSNEILRDATRS